MSRSASSAPSPQPARKSSALLQWGVFSSAGLESLLLSQAEARAEAAAFNRQRSRRCFWVAPLPARLARSHRVWSLLRI